MPVLPQAPGLRVGENAHNPVDPRFIPYQSVGKGHNCGGVCCQNREKSVPLTFRSTWQVKEAIKRIADRRSESPNKVLESIVIQFLNQHEDVPQRKRNQLEEDIAATMSIGLD